MAAPVTPLRIAPGPAPLESDVKIPTAVFCRLTVEVSVPPVALEMTTVTVPKSVRSGTRKLTWLAET